MMCGVADEGSAALFVCGGEGRIWLRRRGTCRTDGRGGIGGRMMPMRPSARQVPRRRSQILGLEDGRSGLDLPGGQIGVRLLRGRGECVGGRGEGLDSPGGRIGVSLLTGAKFGDRMKKIFPEFFVIDL